MNYSLSFRTASKANLPDILRYAQPDLDSGQLLTLLDAERIFMRMSVNPTVQGQSVEGKRCPYAVLLAT